MKKLQLHFIKVEDQFRKYRQNLWNSIDSNSPLGSCPFKFKLKKSNARKRQPLGFCECSQIHYSDLDKHLTGFRVRVTLTLTLKPGICKEPAQPRRNGLIKKFEGRLQATVVSLRNKNLTINVIK